MCTWMQLHMEARRGLWVCLTPVLGTEQCMLLTLKPSLWSHNFTFCWRKYPFSEVIRTFHTHILSHFRHTCVYSDVMYLFAFEARSLDAVLVSLKLTVILQPSLTNPGVTSLHHHICLNFFFVHLSCSVLGFHHIAQASHELTILLPQIPSAGITGMWVTSYLAIFSSINLKVLPLVFKFQIHLE